ncbi:hypothetical protein GMA11_00115 [Granulicatella sp. zg-ZJ]|uniref:hypothetical protein n=1 Tax=Granulicatella sp. zg-ZJ TaxID=2678504 RepID=UPI0013D38240|nr:hypothetical protein [Granulicatella sp. zg-ZJ]NEW61784.1 hypothetical protein [Granulicatella sp. zg-ZJ]
MATFKITEKQNRVYLTLILEPLEEYVFFSTAAPVLSMNQLSQKEYTGEYVNCISLKTYLSQGVSTYMFFDVLFQVVTILKQLEHDYIDTHFILWNINQFVYHQDKECIAFIGIRLIGKENTYNFKKLILDCLKNSQFFKEEPLNNFINMIQDIIQAEDCQQRVLDYKKEMEDRR